MTRSSWQVTYTHAVYCVSSLQVITRKPVCTYNALQLITLHFPFDNGGTLEIKFRLKRKCFRTRSSGYTDCWWTRLVFYEHITEPNVTLSLVLITNTAGNQRTTLDIRPTECRDRTIEIIWRWSLLAGFASGTTSTPFATVFHSVQDVRTLPVSLWCWTCARPLRRVRLPSTWSSSRPGSQCYSLATGHRRPFPARPIPRSRCWRSGSGPPTAQSVLTVRLKVENVRNRTALVSHGTTGIDTNVSRFSRR